MQLNNETGDPSRHVGGRAIVGGMPLAKKSQNDSRVLLERNEQVSSLLTLI